MKHTYLFAITAFFSLLAIVGCGGKSQKSTGASSSPARTAVSEQTQYRNELLHSAINIINTPEQFDDENQANIQIVEQLNQWRRLGQESSGGSVPKELQRPKLPDDDHETDPKSSSETGSSAAGERDPLLETLPHTKDKNLLETRWVRRLNDDAFDPLYDGTFLREAALLRDVAGHVEPANLDELSVAEALFDWTVRNIQLETSPGANPTPDELWLDRHLPLETIFFGRGTPLQRAWVFMLLARQAGLDVVLLATPDPRNPDQVRPWATALVSGGELYLFDYTYGLPIPGPKGKGIATLSQAAADDGILRQMDTADRPYPRRAADLEKMIVLLEASPGYLERRMKLLESQLSGRDRMTLSTSPTALADKLRDMKHVGQIKLWALPYETLEQRRTLPPELRRPAALERMPFSIAAEPEQTSKQEQQSDDSRRRQRPVFALRLGRLLQLRGMFGGTDGQRPAYLRGVDLSTVMQRGAKFYYLRALPTNDQLTEMINDLREGIEIVPGRKLIKEEVDAFRQKRDDAAFWLGVISFEQGDYTTAAQYFDEMTIKPYPNGPWTNAARYLLARCYEAQGDTAKASKLYEEDKSPQRYGNRLRAERLKQQSAEKPQEKSGPQPAEKVPSNSKRETK